MCDAIQNDDGAYHNSECYCHKDQGAGYSYDDEYGPCAFCLGEFSSGQVICAGQNNVLRLCPDYGPKGGEINGGI